MRFTLIYDGMLPPHGTKNIDVKKWAIREAFDPQMRQLWEQRQDLQWLKNGSIFTKDGHYLWSLPHHQHPESKRRILSVDQDVHPAPDELDVCAPISKGGRQFFPLVRRTLGIVCGLKILFLRGEPRGRILQSGDLDNRMKTLIDGLGIPRTDEPYDTALPDPIHCLLEDDSLVTALEVRAEQLLAPTGDVKNEEKEVRLVIEVDVRISHPRQYNALFAGD